MLFGVLFQILLMGWAHFFELDGECCLGAVWGDGAGALLRLISGASLLFGVLVEVLLVQC